MYQVNQSVPVVWRSERCVQFGVDDPALVDGLTAEDAELVGLVRMGIGTDEFFDRAAYLGVPRARAGSLLAILDEAAALVPLHHDEGPEVTTSHTDAYASALGLSPTRVARTLGATDVAVTGPLRHALSPVLTAVGFAVRSVERAEDAFELRAPLVVLTSVWVEDAVSAGGLLEHTVPHLHVVLGQHRATVTHVVDPGVTPCTKCRFLHRTDADDEWMSTWRALWRQQPALSRTDPLLGHLAMAHVAGLLRTHAVHAPSVPVDLEITLPHGSVTERAATFHPECDCRIPIGTHGITERSA
ncbi:hypothetical protein [Brevibacterium samyangense]|uniref:Bacteriocin biosynthesis cyclodehydratase domain-containing protein n=1 Tax=Brevibacterium samyangense TaxID=366888 RepID=A0ABN2T9C2_9MICO